MNELKVRKTSQRRKSIVGSDRLGSMPEDRCLPDGTFTVVFAAEVSPIKGLDVLIDAL